MNSSPRPIPALIWSALLILVLTACRQPSPSDTPPDPAALAETLIETNKLLLEAERQDIMDFISRYGWDTRETGSGLHYYIYREGHGPLAEKGQFALIDFSVCLLTGEEIYSSRESGPRRFLIGQGGVESGLEEGILLMKQGDRAKLIMPPHLAHGLPGDGDRIPLRATIVYDVELLELNQ